MLEGLTKKREEVKRREKEVLAHREAPSNISELQMLLIEEFYVSTHENEILDLDDKEFKNNIVNYWIDTQYSRWFRLLVDEKERKGENPMEITLNELLEFRKKQQ